MTYFYLWTRKSSCANTQEAYRPRHSQSMLCCSGGGGTYPRQGGTYLGTPLPPAKVPPPPSQGTPPSPPIWTWPDPPPRPDLSRYPPRPDLSRYPPHPEGRYPPPVWTDRQTENITSSRTTYAVGNKGWIPQILNSLVKKSGIYIVFRMA